MEHLPKQSIYSLQLDGTGGMTPFVAGTSLPTPSAKSGATWLHLDYGQPEAQQWLLHTAHLNEAAREALLGQSNRPKLLRYGDGLLLILRGINHNKQTDPKKW